MASVLKKDIPHEAAFMVEFWKMVKKFWIPENNDAYWVEVCDYAKKMHAKYPSEYAKQILNAYLGYLDKKYHHMCRKAD